VDICGCARISQTCRVLLIYADVRRASERRLDTAAQRGARRYVLGTPKNICVVLQWVQQSLVADDREGWLQVARLENQQTDHGLTAERFRHFEEVVELLDDGVIVLRNDGDIKYINPAAMRIVGLGAEHQASDFGTWTASVAIYDADGEPVPPQLRPVARVFRTGVAFSRQVYGTELPNGQRRWLLVSGRLLKPEAPADSDILVSFSDITTEREALERLVYQANHDPLTGLPNRAFVLRRITEALAATDGARLRAVLFIDLDDLKSTNDTLGHEAGDDLLGAAAARLRHAVGSGNVVGRLGGDEFVVLIFGAATRGQLGSLVDRLRVRLAEPVDIAAATTPIRASIGVVEVRRGDQRTAEEILCDADRAMYKAKRAGRGHMATTNTIG
jgi:diguanylate cyclase (GGDEF)-like protein